MVSISVGIVDENEIFARGAFAVFDDDPVLDAAHATASDLDQFDVGVVSPAVAMQVEADLPLVVCADSEGEIPSLVPNRRVMAVLLRREATPEQLATAVRAAAAGLRIVDANATRQEELDERSLAVLRLLAAGADTREIAAQLSFSERTIKGVIQRVEQVLGARNRAQAVAEALRRQVI